MRNALILLVVVALVIVGLGAANDSIAFDFDLVFATWTAVSLVWIAAAVAAVVLLTGLIAAWLAQTDASRSRRRLEAELQATYERLRAAEARLPEEPQEAGGQPHEAGWQPEPRESSELLSADPQDRSPSGGTGEGDVPHAG